MNTMDNILKDIKLLLDKYDQELAIAGDIEQDAYLYYNFYEKIRDIYNKYSLEEIFNN